MNRYRVAVLSGGKQEVYGTATGDIVRSGGSQTVESGGVELEMVLEKFELPK